MAANLLRAMFGEVRLYVTDLDTDLGRSLVIHEPSHGDLYTVQDRGRKLERTTCEVVFCPIPGEHDDHIVRYAAFKALRDEGRPQIFVHPLHGSYLATIGDCRVTAAVEEMIRLSVEFVQLEAPTEVFEVTAGVAPAAGPEAVAVQAAKTDAELAAAGLSSTVATDTQASVDNWTEYDLDEDTRRVYVEAASSIDRVDAEISRLQMTTDIKRWTSYVALVTLRDKIRSAAESMTSVASQVFDLYVEVETPLVVLCARAYGADQAEGRSREVRQLNDLRDPALVSAGTTLKMPVVSTR